MTLAVSPVASRFRSRHWWALAVALLVVATVCITVGLHGHRHPLAPPAAAPSPTDGTLPVPPVAVVPAVAHSTPQALTIPAIGLSVSLSTLGLNLDGTVEVPTSASEPGWFRLGPSPGQVGSAVILGHVDSFRGPGAFFQLRSLLPGDQVEVRLADGVLANFIVTSVAQYLKMQFPARRVYASQGRSELQLVTCGGAFDTETGHYLSNIVVYTSFVGTIPPAATPSTTPPAGAARSASSSADEAPTI